MMRDAVSSGDSALNFVEATNDVGKTAAFCADSVYRNGAPRPMKKGTTASP
jgi:hypothetical protein